jgi:hypothetical protein
MFRCDYCDQVSAPREQMNKRVHQTREKIYFEMTRETNDEGNEVIVQGKELGRGLEVVREVSLCKICAKVEDQYA